MQYAFLLTPHANIRYRASIARIARAELLMMLAALSRTDDTVSEAEIGGASMLILETQKELAKREWALLSQQSSVYMLFEKREDGSLLPLERAHPNYVGEDLPSLLKYKGKTNEMFTDALLSMALCASDFAQKCQSQLIACDPICGRATTLFLALRRGWHAVGVETDKNDVKEANDFLTRYLEFHRMKHKKTQSALTVRGQMGGRETRYVLSDTAEHFKDGDTRVLRIIQGDTRDTDVLVKPASVHVMAADLPYGVQHGAAGGEKNLPRLLERAFPAWYAALMPGGAIAVSFNTYVTKRDTLIRMLEGAGFEVLRGGVYEELEHWVEQAVNRDVIVAVKR